MTLKKLLQKSITELKNVGIPTPEIDARVLLEYVLDKDSVFVFMSSDYLLTNSEYCKFRRVLKRRLKREPLAYITGKKEFFGLDFFVNKNVLIPRPETEWIVEESIKYLVASIKRKKEKINVLDVGTGSGNIIISIVKNLLNTRYSILDTSFSASDISKKALYVAKKNAKYHKVNKLIKFYHSDLFSNKKLHKKYDLIIANLPYVPVNNFQSRLGRAQTETMKQFNNELNFEPKDAVFASDNGMEVIKKFLKELKKYLKDGGVAFLEVDLKNAKALKKYFENLPAIRKGCKIYLQKDLSGLTRYLVIELSR